MTLTATQKARRRAEAQKPTPSDSPPVREAYPCPAHCVQVWLAGDAIHIALPPADLGSSRGHCVKIPLANCTIERTAWGSTKSHHRGWEALLGILMDRARLQHNPRAGVQATPTQYNIDAIMRALAAKAAPQGDIDPADLGI